MDRQPVFSDRSGLCHSGHAGVSGHRHDPDRAPKNRHRGHPGGQRQAIVSVAELIKSRALLGKVVDDLKLNTLQTPDFFPVIGPYLYRTFKPVRDGELAKPLFGLTQYAWGGEKIEVFQLEVPEHLLGEKLTLIAGKPGQFSLYDNEHNLLLGGTINRIVEGNGVKIQVAALRARPGTDFSVSRQRTLSTALVYQNHNRRSRPGLGHHLPVHRGPGRTAGQPDSRRSQPSLCTPERGAQFGRGRAAAAVSTLAVACRAQTAGGRGDCAEHLPDQRQVGGP
ncbi:Tyrosine-protein kinase [Pseudomonas amygdali pv. tabaci]|uniref:Tyrosine-protein kinase n=1 Tax=Pseudomonas amygdali pv. tabaci TaxID=322 RepID=A0A3M6GHL4_PSEAJ|nr:Tyrosine-protein kinase [Pseudomonas amygdali pv. tabaci]